MNYDHRELGGSSVQQPSVWSRDQNHSAAMQSPAPDRSTHLEREKCCRGELSMDHCQTGSITYLAFDGLF